MNAKERHRIKLLEYLGNPDNKMLTRADLSVYVLEFKNPEQIYRTFTPDELQVIETESLKVRRSKYTKAMSRIDAALIVEAESGDTQAIKLAYQKFEDWGEKKHIDHSGTLKTSDLTDEEKETLKRAATLAAAGVAE